MIRVISSPSSSTTGLDTLIFAMSEEASWELRAQGRRGRDYPGAIALPARGRKAKGYAL
jgi:hypothetical protein